MANYLIDNNVIANYFAGQFPVSGMDLVTEIFNRTPNISVITEIEALSWRSPDAWKEKIIRMFIDEANIIGLSQAIVNKCIEIRRERKIKTPDAIIAATALVNNLILVTSDSDFQNISDLQLINPSNC